MAYSLVGGRVLGPQGEFEARSLHVAGGRIAAAAPTDAERIDCEGLVLLPGVVDVHGDAFEHALRPRPGVEMPFGPAMQAVDRQMLACGITTGFNALTVSWEPGARSLDAARAFMAGFAAHRPQFLADHRVQIRWEIVAFEALDALPGWLGAAPTPSLAFNDHVTPTLETIRAGRTEKLAHWAARAGVTLERYLALSAEMERRLPEAPRRIAEAAAAARSAGAVLLSHDDAAAADRAAYRALGAHVSEFPMTREAAADAAARGEPIVLGGPNVVRGGSHTGALAAEEAVADGLCTILASDYYYPSLLHAAERLTRRGVCTAPEAWALISSAPAAAMGLTDRGVLAPGLRADVVALAMGAPTGGDSVGGWRAAFVLAGGRPVRFTR